MRRFLSICFLLVKVAALRKLQPLLAKANVAKLPSFIAAGNGPEWCKKVDAPNSIPNAKKLIGFADIHGDNVAFRNVLMGAGLVTLANDKMKWIAEDSTFVVQTGDLVDRGKYDKEVLQQMHELQQSKPLNLFPMMGNHEGMVTSGDFHDSRTLKKIPQEVVTCNGKYNQMIRYWPIVRKVGDVLFAHGGVSLFWAKKFQKHPSCKGNPTGYALVKCINKVQAEYMVALCEGGGSQDLQNTEAYNFMSLGGLRGDIPDYAKEKAGPLWYRGYGWLGSGTGHALFKQMKMKGFGLKGGIGIGQLRIGAKFGNCAPLAEMLQLFNCKVHVIAHTVPDDARPHSFCGGALLQTDVAMSYKMINQAALPGSQGVTWYEFTHNSNKVQLHSISGDDENKKTTTSFSLPGKVSLYTAEEGTIGTVWNQDEANRDSVCTDHGLRRE